MSGLLLIGVAILWLWLALFIARWAVKEIKAPLLQLAIATGIFTGLLIAPLGDEIVGKYQFKSLCHKNGRQQIDFQRIAGRKVLLSTGEYKDVSGTILETSAARERLLDPKSMEPLVTYLDYRSKGGWLIRALGISQTNAPLMFDASCGGYGENSTQGWLDRYQIKVISE